MDKCKGIHFFWAIICFWKIQRVSKALYRVTVIWVYENIHYIKHHIFIRWVNVNLHIIISIGMPVSREANYDLLVCLVLGYYLSSFSK